MSQGTPVVEGYVLCPRPHDEPKLVREEVARCTGGICPEHFAAEGGKLIHQIELVRRGQRIMVPKREKPSRRRYRYRPQRNARKSLNAKARERARKRVADMFPNLYNAILAEEREALGLEPWPTAIAVRGDDPLPEIVQAAQEAGVL